LSQKNSAVGLDAAINIFVQSRLCRYVILCALSMLLNAAAADDDGGGDDVGN